MGLQWKANSIHELNKDYEHRYKDEVFLFLGANDLRPLEEKLKQNLKSR